ncbi:MAG TPA: YCF48-related protein [Candidatus Angelobacter sp.]|nr:YCF48-related protein [Candidatus Angelobacter sp.]
MPELSNLLRQRLGEAQNGNGNHPDADTLTALTEQLLPAAERQQVLAHLSACGQCREVFALSQPQLSEPATQPVIKPVLVSRWRKLFTPTFGLAATAAAAAIIAAVMLVPHRTSQQSPPTPEAKVTQPAAVQPNAATAPQANASTPAQPEVDNAVADKATASDQKRTNNNESSSLRAAAAPPARAKSAPAGLAATSNKDVLARQPAAIANKSAGPASAPVLTAGLKKRDFVNTGIIFAANNTDNSSNAFTYDGLPAAPAPQASTAEATFVAGNPGKITIFQDIPTNLASNQANLRVMTPPPAPEHFSCPMCKAVEKKARNVWHRIPGTAPAINTNALTLSAMGGQGKFSSQLQKEQPAEMAAAPEKPANVEGLQRFEGLSGRSMANAYTDSTTPLWKVLGGKLVKSSGLGQWEDAYPGASFQFSTVNARGNEVWAGGTNASVIHSRDGGATWEVPKLGDSASGSVLSILVSGNTVQIKTSDNQSWSSSDGGKTWAQN